MRLGELPWTAPAKSCTSLAIDVTTDRVFTPWTSPHYCIRCWQTYCLRYKASYKSLAGVCVHTTGDALCNATCSKKSFGYISICSIYVHCPLRQSQLALQRLRFSMSHLSTDRLRLSSLLQECPIVPRHNLSRPPKPVALAFQIALR